MIRYFFAGQRAREWGGLYFPVVYCDACLKPIEREQAGHVCWDDAGNLYHVHKGDCDFALRRARGADLWEEMGAHFKHVLANLKPGKPRAMR